VSAVVKAVRRQRYKGIKALRDSTLIHLYYHHQVRRPTGRSEKTDRQVGEDRQAGRRRTGRQRAPHALTAG
jgi:hypothetical protein